MDRDADLQRAYELIEADSLSDARTILEKIVAADRNNADAWWLLAHAVDSPNDARNALNNVLRVDSSYPGAQALFNTLQSATPTQPAVSAPSAGITRLPSTPTPASVSISEDDDDFDFDFDDEDDLVVMDLSDEDDFDFELDDEDEVAVKARSIDEDDDFDLGDDDFGDDLEDEDELDEDEDGSPLRRFALAAIALLALIAVIVVVFVVKPFGAPTSTPAPATQQVGGVATSTPPAIVPTSDTDTAPEIDQTILQGFYNALSTTQVVPDSGSVETTPLGNTLAFTICVDSLRALPAIIPGAIRAIAGQSPAVSDQVDAVGARFVNCANNNTPLRYIVVSMVDALEFANGILSDADLSSRFEVIQP